jgi:hypothetical protein
VAEVFHCRPSQLLKGTATDLQIDVAAAAALWRWKEQAAQNTDLESSE